MTDVTAIHDLPYPEAADPAEGHLQIQALADAIDLKLTPADTGLYAARPAAGKFGQRYRQTDDAGSVPAQTVWFDNGVAWIVERLGGHTAASQALTATGNISATGGELVTFTGASGQTLTLPAAKQGGRFLFANIDATDNVTIAVQSGEKIDGVTNESIIVGPGERVLFVCGVAGDYSTMRTPAHNSNDAPIIRVAPLRGVQAFTASGTISAAGAEDVTFIGAASQTLTLPAAAEGMRFVIRNLDGTDTFSLARAGSDTINNALTAITISQGAVVDLFCDSAGHWRADERAMSVVAGMYADTGGSPTHNNSGNWQKVGSGGGTLTWLASYDLRPNNVAAQVDLSTNKRLDVRVDGRYQIFHQAYLGGVPNDKTVGSGIAINGTRYEATNWPHASDGAVTDMAVNGEPGFHNLTNTNYVELQAYQNSGGNLTYVVAAAWATRIIMKRLGPNW
jgi:hypothetical protein